MALRNRRIKYFFELWWLVGSGGFTIWVSSTSFQKSSIGWPRQPLTEKVLKFNRIFHDSTQNFFFSKHPNKAEFKSLDEVPSSDFPGLRTSAASTTSMASMTLSVRDSWGQLMLLFWKLVDEAQMGNLLEPQGTIDQWKCWSFQIPLRAIYFRSYHYGTPCTFLSFI